MHPEGEWFGQHGLADDTVEDADRGDADLDGRQEPRRLVMQLNGHDSGAIAVFRQPGQARATSGDEGYFRHGKRAIQDDKGYQK